MSVDLSAENQARLKAAAHAEGISVDACLERLLSEREEFASIVARADARAPRLSPEQTVAKIERGFAQSERGEVGDGESLCAELLAELDQMEDERRAG